MKDSYIYCPYCGGSGTQAWFESHEHPDPFVTNDHVTKATPDLARRVSLRRQSDMSLREQSIRLAEIVFSSRHYFQAWLNEHELEMQKAREIEAEGLDSLYAIEDRNDHLQRARHFAAMSHEHYQVLKLAGIDDVVCACHYCLFSKELVNEKPESYKGEMNGKENSAPGL